VKLSIRNSPIIRRGEIYLVNWDPARGSEQKGTRPALIIQNNTGNDHGSTTIVASISTKFKTVYPFQVLISAKDSGLDYDSVADLGQIMTIDKTRLLKKIGRVEGDSIHLIDEALKLSLDIL
jgi:mRNA interferase MazF